MLPPPPFELRSSFIQEGGFALPLRSSLAPRSTNYDEAVGFQSFIIGMVCFLLVLLTPIFVAVLQSGPAAKKTT